MPENLTTINEYLARNWGIDTEDKEPIYRVVWGPDQFEKRLMTSTDAGIQLLTPEVRTVPKYHYLPDAFILERRALIPESQAKELPGIHKSYEPLWVFIDAEGNPVRPTILGCKFVIDCVNAAIGKKSMAKYKDPNVGETPEESYAIHQARIQQLQDQLFGNESGLMGETTTGSGSSIIVPGNDTVN